VNIWGDLSITVSVKESLNNNLTASYCHILCAQMRKFCGSLVIVNSWWWESLA